MFDGNGNWTSDFSAQADRDNGIKILASRFDNIFIADIKESFENCLTKDGQIAPIGNFNMGGQKITNVGTGTNDTDAVNKSQLDTKVDLTGIQTISGAKTFTNKVEIQGDNGHILFHIPGTMYTRLQESANGLEVRTGDNVSLAPLFAGDSDINHSIVTTVNKSKASNGYFKLGNGLIVQWGYVSGSGGTVTLPTAFSGTNYGVVFTRTLANGTNDNDAITSKNSTSFNVAIYQGGGGHWVAIGY